MQLTRRDILKVVAASAVVDSAAHAHTGSSGSAIAQGGTPMSSRPLLAVRLTLGPTQQLGATPKGSGVIFPIIGGSFEGLRLRGKVLPGGADWALVRADGAMEIDLRIALETEDGALVYMTFQGLRHGPAEVIAALGRGEHVDPARYYFRSVARFETAAPKYQFLNKVLAVGSGELRDGKPIHTFEEVL